MNEGIIQEKLKSRFSNHDYKLTNTYIFNEGWESDFFSITKTGYCYEVEIKISKSDFMADFKKPKHKIFNMLPNRLYAIPGYESRSSIRINGESIMIPSQGVSFKNKSDYRLPNKFYYAAPSGMLQSSDVPAYAGLISVTDTDTILIKEAPFIHKVKQDLKSILLDKFYWKSIKQDYEISTLKMKLA